MSAGPQIADPSITVTPMPGMGRLVAAVCRECSWHTAPNVRELVDLERAHHVDAHRRGAVPAPFHGLLP
ncbi:MAG: hypothetical protein J0I40_10800 [Cellulomonas sp.]|uniref:hypothetical protein n=1 Tax=Cellulomonas sp. 73-92 TaxID=1895740 RepID=UPI0009286078|nr:hypothetical protein [Cellulomonas sp. 73-92]MBN9375859.1 hypothetical protein [Cellulomonas sp.]OJV76537.1 MAG: hypothetical protein BGO37_10835 [Cellulomonas sp. 73-92]